MAGAAFGVATMRALCYALAMASIEFYDERSGKYVPAPPLDAPLLGPDPLPAVVRIRGEVTLRNWVEHLKLLAWRVSRGR
jgi:hypothetical protein